MTKHTLTKSIFMAAFLALLIPAVASAQGTYDPWGRPDYRRDGDYGRDRDYDRDGRYDGRYLRDSIRRLDRLAGNFQRDLDRTLDRGREDSSRHEDHLNADTREFRRAVSDLRNSFDEGRDLNRSAGQARRVLDTANHVERAVQHHFNNQRLYSEWSAIRQELNVIADAYGHGLSDRDDDYYRRGDRSRRDDDIYRRRNPNNDPWWRRIPGFPY